MALTVAGNGGTVMEVDGTTFRASRVTSRPLDHGSNGHYKISATTGSIAAGLAANSEIYQFQWTNATKLAVITAVRLDGVIATTAFAAGQILFRMTRATSWTASGSGGTNLTATAPKQRTNMAATVVGDQRIATTAALGAGTKTFDSQDIGQINTHSSGGTGAATPIIGSIYLPKLDLYDPSSADGEHPLVLAQNEGFAIRATVPGTGIWIAGITVRWAEVAAF